MVESSFSIQELVSLLASTLGQERSQELVRGALDAMKISGDACSFAEAIGALELLGRSPGVVGSVGRFAKVRLTLTAAGASEGGWSRSTRPAAKPAQGAAREVTREELSALLAPTVGQERSDEVVHEALRRMGYPLERFSHQQGLEVLEALTREEGLVGVAARFAKARLIMLAVKA